MVDHDGSLLILISGLAEHTKNILNDSRVSLITHDQNDPHIQTQGRVTVVGNAIIATSRDQCGERYLRYFPEAQRYFEMVDFNFFRIIPFAIRYIGGFGDIHWVRAENYRVPPYPLIADESKLITDINSKRYTSLSKSSNIANELVILGVDCDGFDLRSDGKIARRDFVELVVDAEQAHNAILEAI